jgi:hypothetical protein
MKSTLGFHYEIITDLLICYNGRGMFDYG